MKKSQILKLALTGSAVLGTAPLAFGQGRIVSGNGNTASGQSSVIVGGNQNTTTGLISGIITGAKNTASAQGAGIITGFENENGGFDSVIVAGARGRILSGSASTVILAGSDNTMGATSAGSFIGAGQRNTVSGFRSGIVVGNDNTVTSDAVNSVILTGRNNIMSGVDSAILCGANNTVGSNAVFAAAGGQNARVNHSGSFVWNSGSTAFFSTDQEQFLINADRGVGIGTNRPNWTLEVASDSTTAITCKTYAGSWGGTFIGKSANGTAAAPTATTFSNTLASFRGGGHDGTSFRSVRASMNFHASQNWTSSNQGAEIRFSTADNNTVTPDERMRITHDGRVGIGTTSPGVALDVVGRRNTSNSGTTTSFTGGSGSLLTNSNQSWFASIRASSGIVAGAGYLTSSDARTKDVQGLSDGTADLDRLLKIEIADYLYKDTLTKGSGANKKVIAQQVEEVFPQAVKASTNVVPDIYQKATIAGGWVELVTDLKVGERVRLVADNGHQAVHEVLELREGAFRTAFVEDVEQVFVFGREVNDFLIVDYDAISMLNVSATQELARKLESRDVELAKMRAELTELRDTNHALAKKLSSLDALNEKFARLEKAIGGDEEPSDEKTVAVSLPLR